MTVPPEENPYRPPSGPQGKPPMPPAYIPPAPPPKKSSSVGVILGGLLAAVIVIAFAVRVALHHMPSDSESLPAVTLTDMPTFTMTTSAPPKYVAGECVSMTGSSINPAFDKVDCASGKGNYVIAKAPESGAGCAENYSKYTKGSLKLCLIPVFEDGGCYNFSVAGISAETPKMDCSPFVVKATVLKDTVDTAACGPNVGKALAYPEIKVTYCLNQGS
ncbi:hypothetical protein Lesp02_26850 [Lentzea sp. NBRC 105346]|uniref:LppU/SCO3897 family protein n=1 Tax=Lentzea sp. NBRC 105346 TaxID=3032205 RepID=UPI002556D951|nr:hypothetical protein [Lentzea sp. NBRC 105346]GLZ30496.1 hypothetical protein Lesp02_26850 [Lentzea sp. NBRC 105346]